jgi:hypothetical protein
MLHKWAKGAVARRRFKKFMQIKSIASQKKPVYENGKLTTTKEVLLSDSELAGSLSSVGGGKGLYWNTRTLDIKNGLPSKRRRSNGPVSEQLSSQMVPNIKDKPRRVSSTEREE